MQSDSFTINSQQILMVNSHVIGKKVVSPPSFVETVRKSFPFPDASVLRVDFGFLRSQ